MSFSSDVKKEICSVEQFDREALKAELYGMLLFSRNFFSEQNNLHNRKQLCGKSSYISFAEFIYADN